MYPQGKKDGSTLGQTQKKASGMLGTVALVLGEPEGKGLG